MSIGIETNLAVICSAFNISYAKITNEYSGMTITEIMEEEKAQGNKLADKFNEDLLSNPAKLVEFIQLNNPTNKFAILSNMNKDDLTEMLPLLESDDMVLGLNFFNKDALVGMIGYLPNEQAANVALQMFSPEHLMCLMPVEAMDKVIEKNELKKMKSLEVQCLEALPPEIHAQMIEAVTGEIPAGVKGVDLGGQVQFDKKMLMDQIKGFDNDTFQESLFAIPPTNKQHFMFEMVKEQPKIWNYFEPQYFSMIIGSQKDKDDIIRASSVIGHEQLVGMSANLPQELMSVVLTQMKSELLAEHLQKNFRSVLGELVVS